MAYLLHMTMKAPLPGEGCLRVRCIQPSIQPGEYGSPEIVYNFCLILIRTLIREGPHIPFSLVPIIIVIIIGIKIQRIENAIPVVGYLEQMQFISDVFLARVKFFFEEPVAMSKCCTVVMVEHDVLIVMHVFCIAICESPTTIGKRKIVEP